jgi:hypothetical protein
MNRVAAFETPRVRLMHSAREQEVALAFGGTPRAAFTTGLELGAGDCYQSRYLKRYVANLTCTDYDESLLDRTDPELSYRVCDAERVDQAFAGRRFDLVFSSNMLPHTPNPQSVLTGCRRVTHDESLLVFVVPNPLWKLLKLALFYPRLAISLPRRVVTYVARSSADAQGRDTAEATAKLTNNPKVAGVASAWRRRLLPTPVGAYRGNWAEVVGSRRSRWLRELDATGWTLIRVAPGPFIVGDMSERWNRILGRMGLYTENIYIAKKSATASRYEPLVTSISGQRA